MSEQTRYRLVGAVFLTSLVLIIAPMVFDADGVPTVNVERLPPTAPMQPVQAPAEAFDEQAFDGLVAQVETLHADVDEEGFQAAGGTRLGEATLSLPDDDTAVWAVQVASFQSIDNARTLRTRLREQGYEGFVSSVKRDGQIWHRVAVGPYLDADEADRTLTALGQRLNLEPQLVAFAP